MSISPLIELPSSRRLVDAAPVAALNAIPSLSVNAETLPGIRQASMAHLLPAPPAPRTKMVERMINGQTEEVCVS